MLDTMRHMEGKELEEVFVAPALIDDMPHTPASDESHVEHGAIVHDDIVKTHDDGHIDCDRGEIENCHEAGLPTGVTAVAMELSRELGPFYEEVETHRVEAITIQTSGISIQQGGSIIRGELTEADGFQAMGSNIIVNEDPFGMSLTESSAARRWWEMYDVGVLGKELGSTLCG